MQPLRKTPSAAPSDESEVRRSSDPQEDFLSSTLDHLEVEKSRNRGQKYAVGYAKPPMEHQFQKGRSGNPRGRPSRNKSFDSAFLDEGSTLIAYTDAEGRKRKITKMQAFILRLWGTAVKGDKHSMRLVVQLMTRIAATQQPSADEIARDIQACLNAMDASVCGGPPIEVHAPNDNDPQPVYRHRQRD